MDTDIPISRIAAKSFVVTWINPQALIDGTMLYGSFRVSSPGAAGTQIILGSATASFLWFFGVAILISCFSARFNDKILRIINVVCGAVIILYGGKLILRFVQMLL